MTKEKTPFIPNSTQIPNIILDFVIPQIPPAEARCLLYICRRTYGFHKEVDRISISQFVDGIINRNGKRLDRGAGISKTSVIEAIRNLTGAELLIRTRSSKGHLYSLNRELLVENYIEKVVVKKVNQLRKLTKSGKESRPKQGKILYPQYKGNKGN